MRGLVLLLIAPAVMTQSKAAPPLVPEGIHSDTTGPIELCGITAPDVVSLERKVSGDKRFQEENSTDLYRVFNRVQDFVQFVFPRPTALPFPMATCRKVTTEANGAVSISRQMRCDGSRDQCDRIFLEFEALDKRLSE